MKKLLLTLMISFLGSSLANTKTPPNALEITEIDAVKSLEIDLDFVHKNFIEIPKLKASNFKNKSLKTLGSLASGVASFTLFSKITSAIHMETSSYIKLKSHASKTVLKESLKINPKRTIFGLAISLFNAGFIYNKIHSYILNKYQEEELKKIIERWDDIKNLVEIEYKDFLNTISIKHKLKPTDVDFSEVTKKLRLLIEKKKK